MLLRRGFQIKPGKNILIVEDVITTGKSALECNELAKQHKANVLGFSCIIDRSSHKSFINSEIISQVKFKLETFNENNLPDELKSIKPEKPGSRTLLK